jgi:trk system potassium uptake protein TrkH
VKNINRINLKIIIRLFGFLMLVESVFLLLSLMVTVIYQEHDFKAFVYSFLATSILGGLAVFFYRKNNDEFGKREGYIIVSLVWVVFSLIGTLPFMWSNSIPGFTNAFFETMSGFTGTGASILNDIEALPHGVLFWRSLTQWMGGMGFIVLALAVLPFLGVGGVQLYAAETPGLTADKLQPRVKETAQRLWIIYVGLTLTETILLWLGGMPLFDSLCHSFTSLGTGGFSTKQASIEYYTNPYIHYVIILFMFMGASNFALWYFALKFDFKRVFKNEEFRLFIAIILTFSFVIAGYLYSTGNYTPEKAFRNSLFQVVSIVSTTGFVLADYMIWPPVAVALIFTLMFIGGSTGSTGGGVKVLRILFIFKNIYFEFKRLVHPKAIIPVRLEGKSIPQSMVNSIFAFFVLYLFIFALGSIILIATGLDMDSAMGAVATSLAGIGPGLGSTGPVENFFHVAPLGKWVLSLLMLLGRLELFTFLIIFTPVYWKK